MGTLNFRIIQQLVDFCNNLHKNEFTAVILFVANKYSRRNNSFLTRATFQHFLRFYVNIQKNAKLGPIERGSTDGKIRLRFFSKNSQNFLTFSKKNYKSFLHLLKTLQVFPSHLKSISKSNIFINGRVILHLQFFICNSSFAILHLQFIICNSSFAILHLQFFICNSSFAILHLQFFICNSSFAILHLQFVLKVGLFLHKT
jgi:hypothetical protein